MSDDEHPDWMRGIRPTPVAFAGPLPRKRASTTKRNVGDMFPLSREFLGRFGQGGWRPALLGWGLGSALVALAWAFVFRFASGSTTLADFAALAPVIAVVMQYVHLRGPPALASPTGGLVNNDALAASA